MDSLRGQPNPESRVRAEHIDRSKQRNFFGFSFFTPLEHICVVRANIKGNQQSVVELNA